MKLVIGLGNPGKQYEQTRHNVGFLALDNYLKDKPAISCQGKFKAQICEIHFGSQKVFFVKPQTFMNLSGEAVKDICNFYKLNPKDDILVIHDDIDIDFGKIKEAINSGSAGHNGIKNIIEELGTQKFSRIRVGIENRKNMVLSDPRHAPRTDEYVLKNFTQDELTQLTSEQFPKISELINQFIQK